MRRAEYPSGRTDIRPTVQEQRDQGLLNHNGQAMRSKTKVLVTAAVAIAVIGLVVWGVSSGGGDATDAGSANPTSAATDYSAALAGAPAPLARLYAMGDAIIPGGADTFESELAKLRGHPVVVNKWASWCGPCRFEFPFFQQQAAKQGKRIAFLGVDSDDDTDAAKTFLDELPLPYPSVSDPDKDVDKLIKGYYNPSTAFYDADGNLVYTHQGTYRSEQDLAADIQRHLD